MDFTAYLNILRRRLWILIIVTSFATLASAILSIFFLSPVYETKASFIIGRVSPGREGRLNYEEVLVYEKLIKTYVELAKSQPVINDTIVKSGYDLTPIKLADNISLSQKADTQILHVSIRDTDIYRAINIANAFTDAFIEQVLVFTDSTDIKILNRATMPTKPIKPNIPLNIAAAFFISLMFATGLILLGEHLSDTLKNEEDIKKNISIKVLSSIPYIRGKNKFILNDTNSVGYEAFRILRTSVRQICNQKKIKTIAITGSIPGEGSSVITINLGISMANADFKVLIIDGNFRNPYIHTRFNLSNTTGFSDILGGLTSFGDCILKTEFENLYLITAGPKPANPSELLANNILSDILNGFKNRFDYILVDTPPILVVSDASQIASIADGTILVVSSGKTRIGQGLRAKELLMNAAANIIGVINNKSKNHDESHRYRFYYMEKKKRRIKSL